MFPDDVTRLRHMLDAANDAVAFARGRTRDDLDADRILSLALVKSIEIVGEAASQITRERRARHPEIPWRQIIGMRHQLTHAYYTIRLDTVWDTVVHDLPPLIVALEAILASERPPGAAP